MNDMDTSEGLSLSRRTLLTGAAAAVALAVAAPVVQAAAEEHAHHHHPLADKGRTALIDSALACIKSSEACNAHCIELFKAGDTSVANCAASIKACKAYLA